MEPQYQVSWESALSSDDYTLSSDDYKSESTSIPKKGSLIPLSDYVRSRKDETSIYLMKKSDIEGLEKNYTFESTEEIKRFLTLHDSALIEILYEAYRQIKKIFNLYIVDVCLELDQDYEGDYEGLSVIIKTNQSPERSLDLLDEFDDKWWLDIDTKFLSIMVRPV